MGNKQILLLSGDGIGPEVMYQVERVMDWLAKKTDFSYLAKSKLVGGASYDIYKTPLTDEVLADALNADAILFGAVGVPKWDNVDRELRPEVGLLKLRKELDLYANLRPAIVFDALADASTLRTELVLGLNLMIVRELTAGCYFGEPRGIDELADGTRRGYDTEIYTQNEIERVTRVAFELAQKRKGLIHSVEKSNVMESGIFWRETVTALHKKEGTNITLEHMYADNCAMQLVREPKQFDVIVTNNLFGDILSDCAAMLTGSLGMLPSASLGEKNSNGFRRALYEPVHGSAPDIAGKGLANPIAMFLSFAMMLRYSFSDNNNASLVENAVQNTLKNNLRTKDIMQEGKVLLSTEELGSSVLEELNKLV